VVDTGTLGVGNLVDCSGDFTESVTISTIDYRYGADVVVPERTLELLLG